MTARPTRRAGSETRTEILRIALDLFTRQGYEGTSIRDIAEALGVTKSSLYYHFANKEAIVRALLDERRDEIDELLRWIGAQVGDGPIPADLLQRAALRWIDSTGTERIQGMRFAHANGPVMQRLAATGDDRQVWFDAVVDRVLPAEATTTERLRARMAFDTVSAALFAAESITATDAEVLAAARSATISLTTPESDAR
jgi:AcrR family transcriptional regulator